MASCTAWITFNNQTIYCILDYDHTGYHRGEYQNSEAPHRLMEANVVSWSPR